MPIIRVTEGDLAKSKLIDPGYYGAQIVKVSGLEKSKDGNSQNQIITFRIDAVGKEIDHYFNTKAMGMIAPLVKAATGTDMVAGEFDTDTLNGKKVGVKIITDTYNGSLNNKIDGFIPYGTEKAASTVPY